MKKIILSTLVLSAFIFMTVNAQDLKSKKGEAYLPEKGDWAIGVDVNPFLTYFGGFLSNAGAKAPSFNFFTGDNSIYGKYFIADNKAIRGKLRIGMNSTTFNNYVGDDMSKDPNAEVKDKMTHGTTDVTLGLGCEMRKGKTRLQGFYGAEALLSFSSAKDKFTYGNSISKDNPNPTTTNFNYYGDPNVGEFGRYTEVKYGSTIGIQVRAFVGAEYFILPKMSFGGEFGWGIGFMSMGDGTKSAEIWDGTAVKTYDSKIGNGSGFSIDTDNLGGNLYLMLHF